MQKNGKRKWKVDFLTSKPYAGVAKKENTFHEHCTSFLPSSKHNRPKHGTHVRRRRINCTSAEEIDITDEDTEIKAFIWNSTDKMNPKTNAGVLAK